MTGRNQGRLLRFHIRSQVRHSFFHHAGRLHHLGQEHLAGSEQIPNHAHPRHQRSFDHRQWTPQLEPGFFRVRINIRVDSPDQRVRQPLLNRAAPPFFGLLLRYCWTACRLESLAIRHQTLGRIGPPIEQHVLDQRLQLRLDLLVDFQLPGIHDTHVEPRANGVIQKRRMHRFADLIVAAEAERDVRDATAYLRVRQVRFDPARRVDEVDRVVVVLLHAGGDGEDVGVEDDVLARKADLVDENPVSALADANLVFVGRSLALFVEGHHHRRRAVLQHRGSVLAELRFALLQRNRVHDAFALNTFQAGLDDLPFRRVDHEGHRGDLRLAAQQLQEPRHRLHAVDHALIHADVDDVGPVLHLLPRDRDGCLVLAFFDELRELRRTSHIRPLANHDEDASLLRERPRSRQPQGLRVGDCRRSLGRAQRLTSPSRTATSSSDLISLRGG